MKINTEYQWPYHGSKLIPKDKLRPFLKRNNISGIIHLCIHLGLILLSGILIHFSANIFLKILVMTAHGSFIAFLYAGLHECIHKSAFKNKRLNEIVGYFIGSPAMNLFETEVSSNNSVKINDTLIKTTTDLTKLKNKNVKLGIRSEYIKLAEKQKDNVLSAKVDKVEDLGNYKLLTAKAGNLTIKSKINRETEVPSDSISLHIPAERCCVYEDEKLI